MAASSTAWRRTRLAIVAWALCACGGASPDPDEPVAPHSATSALISEGREAERKREYLQARALYERAVAEAPDATSKTYALTELTRALLFWGALEDGRTALEQLIDLEPERASSWHDLGVVRSQLGDQHGADKALRRAVQLAPRDPRPRIALAAVLAKTERYDEALEHYRLLDQMELPERLAKAVDQAIWLLEQQPADEPAPPP